MAESLATFQGNCHCGANRFDVQLPALPQLVICDCSLCAKKGYVWIYDAEDKLKITRGCNSELLTSYTSNSREALQHEVRPASHGDHHCATLITAHDSSAQTAVQACSELTRPVSKPAREGSTCVPSFLAYQEYF